MPAHIEQFNDLIQVECVTKIDQIQYQIMILQSRKKCASHRCLTMLIYIFFPSDYGIDENKMYMNYQGTEEHFVHCCQNYYNL